MLQLTSRRRFLQNSALAGGGLLLAERSRSFAQSASSAMTESVSAPAFSALRPGAVEPRGWLRAWAASAAAGITGHLDEYNATYHEAWRGNGISALGANPDGTGWPLEQSSYWMDGAIRLGYMLGDQALIRKVSQRLDMVVDGVLAGGESFIYWRPPSAVRDPFNSWAHSHMGRALVAYQLGSGSPRVLEALKKVYRNYPLDDLPASFGGVCGAVNIDAMADVYRITRDPGILANIQTFARRASYAETANAWAAGHIEPGHDVIFYEHVRTPALLYPFTGAARDLNATLAALRWNDANNLLPMGLSSGEEYHAGIGSTRNVETCNVAAAIWTNLCLARITGEAAFLDRVEQIFFNAGPAPVSHDFKTMSYYQRANRYSSTLPQEPGVPGKGSYQFTEIGDPVLCCVGNLNRVIPSYVTHMWMLTPDGGLAAALYGPSHVTATLGGVRVVIEAVTAFPFEETVRITVNPERAVRFPLHFRIPGWVEEAEILVNGHPWQADPHFATFQAVAREWKPGDTVDLHFPMPIRVLKGFETPYPDIPYFKNGRALSQIRDIHNPYASVFYGPLLFSFPIPERDPNQEVRGIKSSYAIDVRSARPTAGEAEVFRVSGFSYDDWNWTLSTPLSLGINAHDIAWTPTELQPLPDRLVSGTPTRIVLVPYGCAKFGISMFPRTS